MICRENSEKAKKISLSREVKEGEESCTRKDKADKEGGQTSGQM